MIRLPIDSHIPQIISEMRSARNFVLQASPGSGKTTRLPPALLRSAFAGGGEQVWVLEPRRLAAKWAARRIAEENEQTLGEAVGYQFRWEKMFSESTRLLFLTEGTFLKRLESNPELTGVKIVMLDEFHERHLQTDVALAYLLNLQNEKRPDLKILICSATLDVDSLARILEPCGKMEIELPRHPVDIRYVTKKAPLETQVSSALLDLHRAGSLNGHTLIFLPGMGEMKRAAAAVENYLPREEFSTHFLHGDLNRDEQDAAIAPSSRKKIILSTNIAESSLTIDGVTVVIDSGLFRQLYESPWSGIPRLRIRPISKASALQRIGRAGRTKPGICVCLFSKSDFDSRPPFEVPEIRRADLTETVLALKSLGIPDPSMLPWIEKPEDGRLSSASHLLYLLGALESDSIAAPLTKIGKRISRMPLSPRLARFLLECEAGGVLKEGISLASFLSEDSTPSPNIASLYSRNAEGFMARRIETQLQQLLKPAKVSKTREECEKRLGFSLLTGFPDRVAKRKINPTSNRSAFQKGEELLLSEGGVALWDPLSDLWGSKYLLVLDVQETERLTGGRVTPRASQLAPLDESWLFDVAPSRITEASTVSWDSETKRLSRLSVMKYAAVPLLETKENPMPDENSASVLLEKGLGISQAKLLSTPNAEWPDLFARLGVKEPLESLLSRISLIENSVPEALFKIPTSAELWKMLVEQLKGVFSLQAANEIAWSNLFTELFCGQKGHLLNEMTPLSVNLPSGRRVSIHYEMGKKPWVESRLQDFFNASDGPSILKGRLPLVLHLLAPNKRAVQVTTDLKGFWARSYPEIRKELSRRYPRHKWPENPLKANKDEM